MVLKVFAKIGTIKGESTDPKHKDEIDVLTWAWGVTQSGSVAHGGGGGAGKASFQDLTFTHHIDRATPLLLKACATGQHVPEATIAVRKPGMGLQDYLIIKLSDVLITSVVMSVAVDESTTAERVWLQAAKVDLEY